MADIAFYAKDIETKIAILENEIVKIQTLFEQGNNIEHLIQEAKSRLFAIQSTRRIFNMELRQMDKKRKCGGFLALEFYLTLIQQIRCNTRIN